MIAKKYPYRILGKFADDQTNVRQPITSNIQAPTTVNIYMDIDGHQYIVNFNISNIII